MGDVSDSYDLDRFVQWWDHLVDRVVADGHACPKIAGDMNSAIDGAKDIIDAAHRAAADHKTLPPDVQKHVMDSAMRMVQSMGDCMRDKAVQASFQRLDFGPKGHH